MFDLSGRKALITGASGGLGGAIARALHAQGALVALSGTREAALQVLNAANIQVQGQSFGVPQAATTNLALATPDAAAKAKLRRQALDWLQAERADWAKLLESGPAQARTAVARTLDHWKQDNDLAAIREAEALAKLPAAEQKEWQALWAEVEALLKRAQGQTPATP